MTLPPPLPHSDVADFGLQQNRETYLRSCRFLHNEGAIRLAHIIREIRSLPPAYRKESNVQKVEKWYTQSFDDLVAVEYSPDMNSAEEDAFAAAVSDSVELMLKRHKPTVMTIAVAIQRLLRSGSLVDHEGTVEFLDRLFMSRIGIRFLLSQHLQAFQDQRRVTVETDADDVNNDVSATGSRWVGAIDQKTNVADIAAHAAATARMLCYDKMFDAPEVHISVHGNDAEITYIPSHIYHILFELLKNSCRATAESHIDDHRLPPVEVLIAKGREDIVVKISDQGGGMPKSIQNDCLFTYMYSTAESPEFIERAIDGDDSALTDMNQAPLAGFGYGLSVSRLYARYLGGDLTIASMDGYGTDAHVYLQSNCSYATEVLPSASASQLSYTSGLSKAHTPHWLELEGHGKRKKGTHFRN